MGFCTNPYNHDIAIVFVVKIVADMILYDATPALIFKGCGRNIQVLN